MHQIGYTTSDRKPTSWGKDFPAGPVPLYIPDPGTRENVDADQWEHVGWVRWPGDGGGVYPTHADVPDNINGRPAYVRRVVPMLDPPPHPDQIARDVLAQPEQPMTFHDYAFIAAYMALLQSPVGYSMDEAIARSHSIASELTRNRANQP